MECITIVVMVLHHLAAWNQTNKTITSCNNYLTSEIAPFAQSP